ncbi:MAG TPA: type II toxin-antitoxin system HicB family antitoxin [Ktedonobacterales bacterium]|nr:type II toxin-antitoxin system HicB family antitoxin [Ktedonobacterales bacterium]
MKYSMVIQWSDEDQVYVVSLPEWEAVGHTGHVHGKTYAEAVRQGEELIENLIEWAKQDGSPIPAPRVFAESTS